MLTRHELGRICESLQTRIDVLKEIKLHSTNELLKATLRAEIQEIVELYSKVSKQYNLARRREIESS